MSTTAAAPAAAIATIRLSLRWWETATANPAAPQIAHVSAVREPDIQTPAQFTTSTARAAALADVPGCARTAR
ncbi:hypothetical protein D3C83_98840 [compost metagenome]